MTWYCGNNTSIGEVWIQHGLNPCLFDTVVTGILFGIAAVFGTFEILIYRKYSTQSQLIPRRSCLYILQILLSVILIIQPALRAVLLDLVLYSKHIAGYQIVDAVLQSVTWSISISLICLERKRVLPSIPTRGHGLVLLLLWTLAFGLENVVFISWKSPLWWWKDRDFSKNVDLGLWIVRYTCTLGLFLLGFRAPGLSSHRDLVLADEEQAVLINSGPADQNTTSSFPITSNSV